MEFENDLLKPEVIVSMSVLHRHPALSSTPKLHLKTHRNTNGLAVFFEHNTLAHTKLLSIQVGRALSGVKTFFRRTVRLLNFCLALYGI
jgi:hypothetical protein